MQFGCLPLLNGISVFTRVETTLIITPGLRKADRSTDQTELFTYYNPGEQVTVKAEGHQIHGKHQIVWHPDNLQAGVYFSVLKTERGTQTTKMIKLK